MVSFLPPPSLLRLVLLFHHVLLLAIIAFSSCPRVVFWRRKEARVMRWPPFFFSFRGVCVFSFRSVVFLFSLFLLSFFFFMFLLEISFRRFSVVGPFDFRLPSSHLHLCGWQLANEKMDATRLNSVQKKKQETLLKLDKNGLPECRENNEKKSVEMNKIR